MLETAAVKRDLLAMADLEGAEPAPPPPPWATADAVPHGTPDM